LPSSLKDAFLPKIHVVPACILFLNIFGFILAYIRKYLKRANYSVRVGRKVTGPLRILRTAGLPDKKKFYKKPVLTFVDRHFFIESFIAKTLN